jgi:hypothetical protein
MDSQVKEAKKTSEASTEQVDLPVVGTASEEIESEHGGSDQIQAVLQQRLSKQFFYQNARTGAISSSPLTAERLSLLLSPLGGGSSGSAVVTRPIHEATMVIEWDQERQAYSEQGWKDCRQVPILREACANWHYQDPTSGNPCGPISCRTLSSMLHKTPTAEVSDGNDEGVTNLHNQTRVWSPEIAALATGSQSTAENDARCPPRSDWRTIAEDLELLVALQAFHHHVLQQQQAIATGFREDTALQTFNEDDENTTGNDQATTTTDKEEQEKKRALQYFLSATAGDDSEEEEEYTSDNGTDYVRDRRTGGWKKGQAIAKKSVEIKSKNDQTKDNTNKRVDNNSIPKKRKKKKAKFNSKNAAKWIYVQGLPKDTDEDEVAKHFQRAGVIDLDPDTQRPRVKLYRDKKSHNLKGDGSICYAREESVDLAVQILDEGMFRPTSKLNEDQYPLSVTRAKFEQRGELLEANQQASYAKKKVARLAAKQAIDWDESENGRITGGLKGLRIIVLKHVFTLQQLSQQANEDGFLRDLEGDIFKECSAWGTVEKITIFAQSPRGVVVVKFKQPTAATEAIQSFHGRSTPGVPKKMEATFWDGVTDYTVRDEQREKEEMDQRHDEFGHWLENQELPEEFRLRVEGGQ